MASWLIDLAISAVVTAVVFWVIVPRINDLPRGALILAIIGAIPSSSFGLVSRWSSPALPHYSPSRCADVVCLLPQLPLLLSSRP
jgi:hypothetical protein